ncbi:28S ribosomal protein S11, mitochondrial [Coregonus clupeaformis]|uniref:28S ribosomal protein S11, mitochondrial n=1 Tax=Coregonus clupeaformis TaxID=59861 RepID=UPI001E1C8122|nr:28S ribosomal protein S11, mitochondrial [Coregonus clupeaformis]
MYKLNCILSNSVRSTCQQVAGSLNAGGSICGTTGLQRAVSSSAVRLQEAASVTATPGKSSKEFSHLPPLPGQDSALRWAGKKYEELPIVHVKATYNKQQACPGDSQKATAAGVTFVRVSVKGLGPGRLSAIKGLTMGGLEVVSITDNTPVPHNGCRPRKARRI